MDTLRELDGKPLFVLALQLSGDYQIRAHSPFPDMRSAATYAIDRDLAGMLRERFAANPKFELVEGDALAGKHELNEALMSRLRDLGLRPKPATSIHQNCRASNNMFGPRTAAGNRERMPAYP